MGSFRFHSFAIIGQKPFLKHWLEVALYAVPDSSEQVFEIGPRKVASSNHEIWILLCVAICFANTRADRAARIVAPRHLLETRGDPVQRCRAQSLSIDGKKAEWIVNAEPAVTESIGFLAKTLR